jgi:hypothetical protein
MSDEPRDEPRYLSYEVEAAALEAIHQDPIAALRRIRIFALTGISTGEYKQALAAIVEITGEELA